jgi:putative transposon-encoded protein
MYLRLHVLKLVHPALDPSDPLHHVFCLVHPVTDIPLEGVVPVGNSTEAEVPALWLGPRVLLG